MEGVDNIVLQESYNKLKNSQALEAYERRALERFTDTFVTCTRCISVAGAEAVKNAEETNWHGHSSSCKKGGRRTCRWKFPRYPLERTIFVDANRNVEDEQRMDPKMREEILDRVMRVLVQEEDGKKVLSKRVKRIMLSYPNVKRIADVESSSSEEDQDSFSESEDALQNSISAERQTSQQFPEASSPQEEEHPRTPSPRHYLPDDYLYLARRKRKKTEQPLPHDSEPPAKKAKKKSKPNTVTYLKMESPEEYKQNTRKRIDRVLKIASAGGDPITYAMYERAVIEQARKGSEVLLQRDIDEIFINNYNPEWIVAWNANIDISPVYDYYGTITYVTDYYSKDSTGMTEVLKTAVKQLSDDKDMRQKCHEMANLFMTHRQVGMSEAIYKLLANMNMTYSSIATIWVPTDPPAQRRNFLMRQDPEGTLGFELDDKKGRFLEKPDLISKYERRKLLSKKGEEGEEEMLERSEDAETLEQLTFCQWVKMYEGKGWQQRKNEEGEAEHSDDEDRPEEGQLDVEDDLNYLITGRFNEEQNSRFDEEQNSTFDEEQNSRFNEEQNSTFDERKNSKKKARRRKLPQLLTLQDPMPGEPRILHKRTFPRALRFFKKKHEKNPHLFYFTKLMLFHPFRDENELFPEDPQKCEELYLKHKQEIIFVEAQLLPFMESVEEAQVIYDQMRANDEQNIEDKMGADLDPEMEQEIADGDDLDDEEHPDYYHIDPDQVEANPEDNAGPRRVFKTIVLPDKDLQVILINLYNLFNVSCSGATSKKAGQKAEGGAWPSPPLCQKNRDPPHLLPAPVPPHAHSTLGNSSWGCRVWQVLPYFLHLCHDDCGIAKGWR